MNKERLKLMSLLLAGLLLRLLVSRSLTYELDLATYITWGETLSRVGFKEFFASAWVDYVPGYLYVLRALDILKTNLALTDQSQILSLYKLPSILADVMTAGGMYLLVRKIFPRPFSILGKNFSTAVAAAAVYLFNPAVWANSALWGQTDSFTALAAVFALLGAVSGKSLLAGLSLGLGALIKLNTLIIVPVLWFAFADKRPQRFFMTAVTALVIFSLGFLPFYSSGNFFSFIKERVKITLNQYQHTSVNAFNSWFVVDGPWQSDQTKLLGVRKQTLGTIGFFGVYLYALMTLAGTKAKKRVVVSVAAAGFLAAFFLLTRMHERHLLPAFPFLTITAILNPILWWWYGWWSVSYLINLVFGFQQVPGNVLLVPFPDWLPRTVSAFNLLFFVTFLGVAFRQSREKAIAFLKNVFRRLLPHRVLLLILLGTLVLRLVRLSYPPAFYFDEVYHAFTASEMLKGNTMAWEWWHDAPEGVAYEWTHPPLAKYFMVAGMALVGKSAFGWRFPGVLFGVATVYLVYLVARRLFEKNGERIGILAALLYAVESLAFVQSRIGMNDTYLVFFSLLTILALLRQKYFASALSFALAFATKWSAVYLVPVILLTYLWQEKFRIKKAMRIGIWYLIIPTAVYLVVYLPFFIAGNGVRTFVELQQQMYWYHTRLEATHDYASSWWSWPLVFRPVWYYVNRDNGLVANIYALGNPVILWGGIGALVAAAGFCWQKLIKKISWRRVPQLILILGFLSFWLPWSLSPRIMFFYHYLPSIPFLVILLAWLVAQGWQSRSSRAFAAGYLLVAVLAFFFFYPHLTAVPLPEVWTRGFFWFPSWR